MSATAPNIRGSIRDTDSSPGALDLTDLGIVIVAGLALFAVRLVLQQTWISFHRGSIEPSSWPVLGVVGAAAFTVAILWTIAVFASRSLYRRPISTLDGSLMTGVLVCGLLCAVPGEQWRLATAHVAGARHAPKGWIVWSAARGDIRLLDYLLSQGASADARVSSGQTALGAAAAAGQLAACELLIAKGAHVDERTSITRQTPLMEAAEENRAAIVRLLLARGADPAARDTAGMTAEDWAVVNGNERIRGLLRSAGTSLRGTG